MKDTIRYIIRRDLDTGKWDRCIRESANGEVYALSDVLDHLSTNWDALVLGDYAAVMPLPWRKKWLIHYIYYPPFCAFLGVYGHQPDAALCSAFLNAIPSKFKYWDFPLNPGNPLMLQGYQLRQRKTYLLSLQPTYEEIAAGYRSTHQRNIKKAAALGLTADKNFSIEEVIELATLYTVPGQVSSDSYQRFQKLYSLMSQRGQAITYGIRDQQQTLLASAAFLFFQHKVYYLVVGNHPNGKTVGASHALIDAFIRDHASRDLELDFEGSDLRNLAFFYSSFGAREVPYAVVKENRLPFWIRWIKP